MEDDFITDDYIGSTTISVSFLIEKGEGKECVVPVFDKAGKRTAEILVSASIKNSRSTIVSKKEVLPTMKKNSVLSKSVTKMPALNSLSASPSIIKTSNNTIEVNDVVEEAPIELSIAP
jgi:hypothetical protein